MIFRIYSKNYSYHLITMNHVNGRYGQYSNSQCFRKNDKLHRDNAPAVIYTSGRCEWFTNGNLYDD